MKDVYKNIKNIGSMVCKRWSRWSFDKKRGFKPVVTMVLAFGYKRWSCGGHRWSSGGHLKKKEGLSQ